MIREPQLTVRELLSLARWVRDQAPGLELWVNGRLDVALAAGCGCHAPESYPDPPPGLLPRSRPLHHPDQLPRRAGLDQLILSPIFPVPGKGPAWGPERLRRVLDNLPAPAGRILALGGITPGNAAGLHHPRLDGVALLRALWSTPEPVALVAALRDCWNRAPKSLSH
jgi:thiamine monophosphate synthase